MNYEALVGTRSCIKLEQGPDLRHLGSRAIGDIDDIIKSEGKDGRSN
jgi:hypothetical protein